MIIADQFIWLHIPKTGGTHTRSLFSHFADVIIDQSCGNPMQPGGTDYKHDTISVRLGKTHVATEGKKILANIRRLPSFIVSHSIHIIEILGHRYKMLQDTMIKEKSKLRTDTLRIVTNNLKKYRQEALLIHNYLNDPEQLANGYVWVSDPSFWGVKDDLLNNHAASLLTSDMMLQSPILNCDSILRKYIGEHGIDTWLRTESLVDDFIQTMKTFTVVTEDKERVLRNIPKQNVTPNRQRYSSAKLNTAQLKKMYACNPLWAEVERLVYGSTLADE